MIYKAIKVKPNSHQNKFLVSQDGNWLVDLTAQPVKGEANKQLIEYLSEILKIPKRKINIQKGSQSKFKKVELDIEENELEL